MFHRLVSHNDDLRRLVDKGYAVGFDNGYLIVRDVPYLDQERQLQRGAIVTKLEFVDGDRVIQGDHQVFFAGSVPHQIDGTPIANLGGGPMPLALSDASADVIVQRIFSNKPVAAGRFEDFYHKIDSYVIIISGPAMEMYGATPYTFRSQPDSTNASPFKFQDTLTSRAEITDLSARFQSDIVAVIGLGGTGSYLLDLLVKTPVNEIRAFDSDTFHVHNAYRSPGRLQTEELGQPKADVYRARYDNFRTRLSIEQKFIEANNVDELDGVTFAFVCVDKGSSRKGIFDLLIEKKIPFIDVGMGLKRKDGTLRGMVRATAYAPESANHIRQMNLAELEDDPEDLYRSNIQIGELNALNACLAIIRFKQLRGFYADESGVFHLLFNIGNLKITGLGPSDED